MSSLLHGSIIRYIVPILKQASTSPHWAWVEDGMKRLLNFSNISKKREQTEPTLNTSSLPKVAASRGDTSPTISRRPTARNTSEPWQLLDVLATQDALLIRPRHDSALHLKVAWGKKINNVTEVKDDRSDLDWESSSIQIHGIVGMITLFSGKSSSRSECRRVDEAR